MEGCYDRSTGEIEKVEDLRTIWKHEAHDFTKWLAEEENLSLLSKEVGIDILLESTESPVGNFNVDIFAREEGTNRKVIIENQLEDTNHDHLGKIITYASGKNADVVIWIVKRAREEHRQAIEWLNQHTDEQIGFFLIEIELWKIDESLPAVRFNVVERPNDWAKAMKAAEGLSDTKRLQLEFWQQFVEYAFGNRDFAKCYSRRKPMPQHWYDMSVGSSSYHMNLFMHTQKNKIGAGLYVSNDKETYNKFLQKKDAIEQDLGEKLLWREAEKDCRFYIERDADIKKDNAWKEFFDWYCEMSLKFKGIVNKYDV